MKMVLYSVIELIHFILDGIPPLDGALLANVNLMPQAFHLIQSVSRQARDALFHCIVV